MDFQEKINKLKKKIFEELTPLIDSDYILIDLPYHSNIGDLLIWEGEENFLKTIPFKCLYRSSNRTFEYKKISDDVIVLIHGGGNFGDVWRAHQIFHLNIVKYYPNNKIIFLPQTVHYDSKINLGIDSEIMSKHKNLTICARDNVSYGILHNYFANNTILLEPDMAFYINPKQLENKTKPVKDILFLKRTDHEISLEIDYLNHITEEGEIAIHDWPTMEQVYWQQLLLYKMCYLNKPYRRIADAFANTMYRKFGTELGVEFLSEYKYIYTTRLHGAILSILLKKRCVFFNNSYGKNSSFYDTWLSDIEEVKFIYK